MNLSETHYGSGAKAEEKKQYVHHHHATSTFLPNPLSGLKHVLTYIFLYGAFVIRFHSMPTN